MNKPLTLLGSCLLTLALLPGCAQTTAGDYLMNRGGDLSDALRLNLKAGQGIGWKFEATRLVHAGFLWENGAYAAGFGNRELAWWQESALSWGLVLGHHQETILRGMNGRYSGSYGWNFSKDGGSAFEMAEPDNFLDLLGFRGTVMLLVGIDAELRVGELLDFVVGLFQFDPSGDDVDYSSLRRAQ